MANGILDSKNEILCGEKIEIVGASEPTDIIWENRYFTPAARNKKRCISSIIILMMLMVSGAIIYAFSSTATHLKFRYPVTTCKTPTSDYKNIPDPRMWEKDAFKEYLMNEELKAMGVETMYTEILACFCRAHPDKHQMYTMVYKDAQVSRRFCEMYFSEL